MFQMQTAGPHLDGFISVLICSLRYRDCWPLICIRLSFLIEIYSIRPRSAIGAGAERSSLAVRQCPQVSTSPIGGLNLESPELALIGCCVAPILTRQFGLRHRLIPKRRNASRPSFALPCPLPMPPLLAKVKVLGAYQPRHEGASVMERQRTSGALD